MISDIEPQRLVEAAAWRTRLAEGHTHCSAELAAWLAEHPQNEAAWKRVQTPWALLGEQATAPELIRLRRAALAHAHEAGQGRWLRSRRGAIPGRLATAAGILAVAVAAVLMWHTQRPNVYRTPAEERRVVTLSDGSQIALDSRSEVRVRYTARARELTLAKGQARFDVAHDVERPFSVTADGHKIIATGTAFNVDLLGSSLLVTLIEGHVVVLPESVDTHSVAPAASVESSAASRPPGIPADKGREPRSSARIVLDAGEQLVISPTAPPNILHINVDRATAWQNGELVFENEQLSNVVARVNRYGAHPIVIDDDPTASVRISGVFRTGDIEGFVSTIVSYLPLRAQKATDGSIRLSSRVSASAL
jgi:transmembrane sensor